MHLLDSEPGERLLGRIIGVVDGLRRLGRELDRPSRGVSPGVDQAVVGDREDPAAEPPLLAVEGGDVPRHLEKDLAEDVLGIGRPVDTQIAEDDGRKPLVELLPGGLAAFPGRLQERGEALRRHPFATVAEFRVGGRSAA
jgi:hypothetical protein